MYRHIYLQKLNLCWFKYQVKLQICFTLIFVLKIIWCKIHWLPLRWQTSQATCWFVQSIQFNISINVTNKIKELSNTHLIVFIKMIFNYVSFLTIYYRFLSILTYFQLARFWLHQFCDPQASTSMALGTGLSTWLWGDISWKFILLYVVLS